MQCGNAISLFMRDCSVLGHVRILIYNRYIRVSSLFWGQYFSTKFTPSDACKLMHNTVGMQHDNEMCFGGILTKFEDLIIRKWFRNCLHTKTIYILTHILTQNQMRGGGEFTPRPTFCCITPEPQQTSENYFTDYSQSFLPHMTN